MLLTGNREVAICPACPWWRKNVQPVWMSPCSQAVFRARAEGELMLADVCQDCLESWVPAIWWNSFPVSPRCPLGSQWLLSAKLTWLWATVWMWYLPMDRFERKNVFNCLAKSPPWENTETDDLPRSNKPQSYPSGTHWLFFVSVKYRSPWASCLEPSDNGPLPN